MQAIQFYFTFGSPYSYLASLEIEDVAASVGRPVEWRPIELLAVWSRHGVLDAYMAIRRLKRPYILRDAKRCADMRGVAMVAPSVPTQDTTLAKQAYWGLRAQDAPLAKRFLQVVWHRYFAEGKGIDAMVDLADVGACIGLSAEALAQACDWPGARQAQDEANSAAVASACFGVPWFTADGAAFFGQDRLDHLAQHLKAAR